MEKRHLQKAKAEQEEMIVTEWYRLTGWRSEEQKWLCKPACNNSSFLTVVLMKWLPDHVGHEPGVATFLRWKNNKKPPAEGPGPSRRK